jgi:hypothetical protein
MMAAAAIRQTAGSRAALFVAHPHDGRRHPLITYSS